LPNKIPAQMADTNKVLHVFFGLTTSQHDCALRDERRSVHKIE
jgi:hypothetical protein